MSESAKQYVTALRLASLLKVPRQSLTTWRSAGLLAGEIFNQCLHHSLEAVDALLASCPQNIDPPLTAYKLLCGEVELIGSDEAAALAGVSKRSIHNWMACGRISYIRLPMAKNRLLIVKASLKEKPTIQRHPSPEQVSLFTGLHIDSIRRLITQRKLKKAATSTTLHLFVEFDSVYRLLSERLPNWIHPMDWIDDRLTCGQPLLSPNEASRQLGTKSQLDDAIEQRLVRYINRSFRGHSYPGISPESITAFVDNQTVLDVKDIAAIFGSEPRTLTQTWRPKGYVICPLHTHNQWDYKKACLLAYLDDALPGKADKWYDRQTTDPQKLFDFKYAMRYLKTSRHTVQALIESGQLEGLRLPSDSYCFTLEQLDDCAAKLSDIKQ